MRRVEPAHTLNHPAAITPVTDGETVYVFFPEYGLIAYDAKGKERWKVPLGPFSNENGHSSCPIIAGDNVILVLDQMVGSYIAAFDRRNGELRWKTPREEMDGYATPLLYQPTGAAAAVITASRGQLGAHRVDNGKRLWSWKKLSPSEVASPILVNDTLFTFGYGNDKANPFSAQLQKYDKNHDGKLTPDEYGDDAYLKGVGLFVGNRDGDCHAREIRFPAEHVRGALQPARHSIGRRRGRHPARVLEIREELHRSGAIAPLLPRRSLRPEERRAVDFFRS